MSTPKDFDAKVRLGYVEQDSIVWADQREKLVGRDWRKRKKELWDRCGGRCEWVSGATLHRCIEEACDPHHIQKRSVLRDDRLSNLQALCRRHHDMLGKKLRFGEGK